MPPRGRTMSPWWTHFQAVEGCTYLNLGRERNMEVGFTEILLQGVFFFTSPLFPIYNFHLRVLQLPYPQPLKTTLGFPLNSTNDWGLQLWIKIPILCNSQVLEKIRGRNGEVRLSEESSSASSPPTPYSATKFYQCGSPFLHWRPHSHWPSCCSGRRKVGPDLVFAWKRTHGQF